MSENHEEPIFTEVLLRLEKKIERLERKIDLIENDKSNESLKLDIVEQLSRKSDELERKINDIYDVIVTQVNLRTMTLEWLQQDVRFELKHLHEIVSVALCKYDVQATDIIEKTSTFPKYQLICQQCIAVDSPDNIDPESTFEGEVSRPLFVLACERIVKKEKINFLDIGCGGGAIVFDFIKRGHFAVGLDGSDACRALNKGYWKYLKNLDTCDVTKKFEFIKENKAKLNFDIITMWEVFEHIPEDLCPNVLKNVYFNLSNDGLFVGSISRLEYINSRTGIPYHVTLKDLNWWRELFNANGFELINSEFRHEEYCRGVGNRYQDQHDYRKNPDTGFHFTAKKIVNFLID